LQDFGNRAHNAFTLANVAHSTPHLKRKNKNFFRNGKTEKRNFTAFDRDRSIANKSKGKERGKVEQHKLKERKNVRQQLRNDARREEEERSR
jgi:hypothetical protein